MGPSRLLAVAVVGALGAVAGCAADEPDAAVGDPATTSTVAPATTLAIEDVDDVDSIIAVVEAGFGETDNPFAALRPVTGFPEGVPVPPGAVATELYFSARTLFDDVEASVEVWTPAAPDDVATLYRTALPALGYEVSGGQDPERDDRSQSVDYAEPTTGASIHVGAFDLAAAADDGRMTSPDTGTALSIQHTFTGSRQTLDRLGGWATDLPVDVERIEFVSITSDFEPRDALGLSVTLRVPGEPDAIAAAIEETLSDASPLIPGYRFDEDDIGVMGTTADGRRTTFVAVPVIGEEAMSEVIVRTCVPLRVHPDDRRRLSPYLIRGSCEEDAGLVAGTVVEQAPATTLPPEPVPLTGQPATAEELVAATKAVLGPTDDVVADLAVFATLPDDVPTPTGTQIERFDVRIDLSEPRVGSTVHIYVRAPGSIADLTTFFEAKLTAAGYTNLGTRANDEGQPTEQRDVAFTTGDGGLDDPSEILVSVGDMYTDPSSSELQSGTPVSYSINGIVEQGRLAGHTWALPLTGIDAEAVRSWKIAASAEPQIDTNRQELRLGATYDVADPAATIEGILADPPDDATASVSSFEPDDVFLDRPGFEAFWVAPYRFNADEGLSAVDVGAAVGFDVAG